MSINRRNYRRSQEKRYDYDERRRSSQSHKMIYLNRRNSESLVNILQSSLFLYNQYNYFLDFFMKIFHTLLIIFLLLSFSQTYGNSEEESGCGTASGYALYTCRKAKMCKKEKFKINKPLLEREGNTYKELPEDNESLLKEGKKIYRERIGKLYSCGILSVQKNSYEKNSTLLDIATPSLKTTKKRSQKQIEQIKRKIKKLECKEYKNEEKNTLKQDMLKEATYEMCDYINYLEYLKGYYNVPSNTLREQ